MYSSCIHIEYGVFTMIIEKKETKENKVPLSTRVPEMVKKSLTQEAKEKNFDGVGSLVREILEKYTQGE